MESEDLLETSSISELALDDCLIVCVVAGRVGDMGVAMPSESTLSVEWSLLYWCHAPPRLS
jgi:hypothetical protein